MSELYFPYNFLHAKQAKLMPLIQGLEFNEEEEGFFRKNLNLFYHIRSEITDAIHEDESGTVTSILFKGVHHHQLSSLSSSYSFRREDLMEAKEDARTQAEKDALQAEIDKMNILSLNDATRYVDSVLAILHKLGYQTESNIDDTGTGCFSEITISWKEA